MKLFLVCYDFSTQKGGTYHTMKSWLDFFRQQGDQVFEYPRMPTDDEVQSIRPDAIISAQWASFHINDLMQRWRIPHIVLTFGPEQYVLNGPDSAFPILITYSNQSLLDLDKQRQPHEERRAIIKDPILLNNYLLKEKSSEKYITLVGSPPQIKGHDILLELARMMPDQEFLLVTDVEKDYTPAQIRKLPKNVTLQPLIFDLDEYKQKVYGQTKLLIVPSIQEAYSRVSIEATVAGIPTLISSLPSLPEVTLNQANYVQDYRNPKAWKEAIDQLFAQWPEALERTQRLKEALLERNQHDLLLFRQEVQKALERFPKALQVQDEKQRGKSQSAGGKKTLIVMGNGPSLKDVDFKQLEGFDCFGLNAAYRAYEKMNWWPTYFGCFDYIVAQHHAKDFTQLIQSSPIKRFFFLEPKHFSPEVRNHPKFQKINFVMPAKPTNYLAVTFDRFVDAGNSGANACQAGILMGYKKIILLGVDCNYVELVEGAKVKEGSTVVMEKTPEQNPNYWFDNYQQKGDIFHLPNAQTWHVPYWKRLSQLAKPLGIDIVNCSPISKLDCFRKGKLEDELR